MTEERKSIVAAVVVQDKETLLIQRRVKEGSLLWAFCSGEVEDGETPIAAAIREAREELGVLIGDAEEIGRRTHPITGRNMIYVSGKMLPESADPVVIDTDEIKDVVWASLDDVNRLIGDSIFEPVWEYLKFELTV